MHHVCDSLNYCGDYSDEMSADSVLCGKFDSFYCRTAAFAELQSCVVNHIYARKTEILLDSTLLGAK